MNNKGLFFLAISLILIGFGCSSSSKSRAVSEKAELEGTWIGSSANQSGGLATFVFSGSEFRITMKSEQLYKGILVLNADVLPKQVDVNITESAYSNYVGKKALVIYELRNAGDSLIIAANEPGVTVRPTSFEVVPGSRTAIFMLERKKTHISKTEVQSNRDALINDLNNLAAFSYQYRIRPSSMGGGNGAYIGLKIPEKLGTNENGTFTFTITGPDKVKIKAVSKEVEGAAIETTLDGNGRLGSWTYFGKFM